MIQKSNFKYDLAVLELLYLLFYFIKNIFHNPIGKHHYNYEIYSP